MQRSATFQWGPQDGCASPATPTSCPVGYIAVSTLCDSESVPYGTCVIIWPTTSPCGTPGDSCGCSHWWYYTSDFVAVGVTASPSPSRSLQSSCTAAIAGGSGVQNYGLFPTSGTQTFCTNVLPAQYANNALQLSRHQAAPGYLLTLTAMAWETEADFDFGVAYTAAAGTAVTTTPSCALTGGTTLFSKYAGSTIPAPGSWNSAYGAQIGLCFYSDGSVVDDGISYTITSTACPAGYYCPANAATPTACGCPSACPAGTTANVATCPSACTAIPQGGSGGQNYGLSSTSGTQTFCTNVLPAQYAASALQLSRHQAAPGHRLTLTVDAWATEACCDKGAVSFPQSSVNS